MATIQLANLLHQAVGFEEDADDALVVVEIVASEGSAFAVFEPFLGWLIATNVEIPRNIGDITEILRCIQIHSP